MAAEPLTLKGVVHGKRIDLDRDPGIPAGQEVTVTVHARSADGGPLAPGEGVRRSAGTWADDVKGLEEYLEWSRQQRRRGRPELEA